MALIPAPVCVSNDAPDQGQPLVLGGTADAPLLYLRRYAGYEQRVGQRPAATCHRAPAVPEAAAREWLDRFFVPNPEAPAATDWQKVACAVALRARLSVITGGPGTGKTYTAARLLALLLALHEDDSPLRVALAAPTGKAAARLKQSIDNALTRLPVPGDSGLDLNTLIARMGPARTLHSLLGRAARHAPVQPPRGQPARCGCADRGRSLDGAFGNDGRAAAGAAAHSAAGAAGRQGPAGLGRSRCGAGRPVPRRRRGPLQRGHRAVCADRDRADLGRRVPVCWTPRPCWRSKP
jgi:ATP-dependent exoDNAse (exonuclease V) alpha subunit